ncbi:pyoverdine export/recycling transporter outer membrane subunit OmpQ [Pandoraea terrae]
MALLLPALAACSLTPPLHRPDADVPSQWSRAVNTSANAAATVDRTWWESFGDPTLTTLVDRSLGHSFTLDAAIARLAQARASAVQAGSPQFPALGIVGAASRTAQSGDTGNRHSQSVFLSASYELDLWRRNGATANAASTLADAVAFDRDVAALSLAASVADTYFAVQALRARLRLAHEIVDNAEQIEDLVQAQYEAGVATQLQLEQQRNALATFRAAVPSLQLQLNQNLHALAVLSGADPVRMDVPDASLRHIRVPEPVVDMPATVLERRPDIRAAESRLVSANFSVGAARAAFFPSIVLTAEGGVSSNSLAHFLANPLATVAAALTAPLLDGGLRRGQLAQQQAVVDERTANYRQAVLSALQDTEDALSAVHLEQMVETEQTTARGAARAAATLAQAQYRAGTIDFMSVLDSERTAYQAEDALLQTRLLRLQAAVGLFRALGGGFDAAPGTASLAEAALAPHAITPGVLR